MPGRPGTRFRALSGAEELRERDIRERMAKLEREGLALPAAVQRERAERERRADAEKEIEKRRHSERADVMVRRDGRIRKGAHTQSAYRARLNRKAGMKGLRGAR